MSEASQLIERAKEIRKRLRFPTNSVIDRGINLSKSRNPYNIPPLKVINTPPKIFSGALVLITEEETNSKKIRLDNILRATANHFGIGVSDIRGPSRRNAVAYPRHIAIYLATKHCKGTLSSVARNLNRDHTTALHSREKIKAQLDQPLFYCETARAIAAIEESIFGARHLPAALSAVCEFHVLEQQGGWEGQNTIPAV